MTRCFLQANRWSLLVWHDLIENTFCSLTFLHTKLLFNLHAHKSLTLQTPARVWQETKASGKNQVSITAHILVKVVLLSAMLFSFKGLFFGDSWRRTLINFECGHLCFADVPVLWALKCWWVVFAKARITIIFAHAVRLEIWTLWAQNTSNYTACLKG